MSEPSVLIASERDYDLAEGRLWDAAAGRVLWVDISGLPSTPWVGSPR